MGALQDRLHEFDVALSSEDGINPRTGKAWSDYIDLDSFARKYLVEEILENCDAGVASQYFFWNAEDDRIYAGPCWDYDNILGVGSQKIPNCFLARRPAYSHEIHTPLYSALWQRDDFRETVLKLYRSDFLPVLKRIIEVDLPRQAKLLETASRANSLRWHSFFTENRTVYPGSVDYLFQFLKERFDFLNSAWIDGIDYKTITLDLADGSNFKYFCLPAGSTCEDVPAPKTFGAKYGDTWYLADGSPFDVASTLNGDIWLYEHDTHEKK